MSIYWHASLGPDFFLDFNCLHSWKWGRLLLVSGFSGIGVHRLYSKSMCQSYWRRVRCRLGWWTWQRRQLPARSGRPCYQKSNRLLCHDLGRRQPLMPVRDRCHHVSTASIIAGTSMANISAASKQLIFFTRSNGRNSLLTTLYLPFSLIWSYFFLHRGICKKNWSSNS